METILSHGSPLAAYLEGSGQADLDISQADEPWAPDGLATLSFAPQGRPDVISALRKRHTGSFLREPRLSSLRAVGAAALNSTLGRADNERFLEHFRYTIIASQLLQEHYIPGTSLSHNEPGNGVSQPPFSVRGVGLSAFTAFALVWVTKHAYVSVFLDMTWNKIALTATLMGITGAILYAYMRRYLLLFLRRRAISAASDFVTGMQSFGSVTSSMLTLIQEVELVSRGYRISTPLPPVSRLGKGGDSRRCARLRRNLQNSFNSVIPAFANANESLRSMIDENALDQYLEVYDIRAEEIHDAASSWSANASSGNSKNESLLELRALQTRYSTLRRLFLCSLLSLPATGRKIDIARWRWAINEMSSLDTLVSQIAQNLRDLMSDEERLIEVTANSEPTTPSSPNRDRLHSQIRRISTLSTGIKSLQAKMYLLREDSARALSKSTSEPEVASISVSLRDQYEALGTDLKALMQAWETGKAALATDIIRHERRVSRTLSGLSGCYDPSAPSPGGLTAVNEAGLRLSRRGSPNSALRALNGEPLLPLSPPATENGSVSAEDDEVFEAVAAAPLRQRSTATRAQRVAKMREDREKQLLARDQKDASSSMMRELEAVIHLRPVRRNMNGRITSL